MILLLVRLIIKLLLGFIAFAAVYLIAAFTLPFITIHNSFRAAKNGVKIFVLSNGVHTDFVVPAITPYKNWQADFAKEDFHATDPAYAYIGFGWGDKGFYLDTPTWADLKFSTAFNAVFWLSETAMHVTYHKEPDASDVNCAELLIDEATYLKLIAYIESGFKKNENGIMKIDHKGYGSHDLFYEAKGTYSLFKTCNTWTNNGLKKMGVKTALWSPFSKGLIRSLKD
jgi:uncharacterized protein (TIGR02117 family)